MRSTLFGIKSREWRVESGEPDFAARTLDPRPSTLDSKAVAVYVSLVGANENPASNGEQTLRHRTNYFKGERSNWRTDIPNHQSVRMSDVYQGIDMVWDGTELGSVRSDFVIQPNADPNQIQWQVKGADAVELDAEGNLIIKTEFGEIKRQRPVAYQDENGLRQGIESRFVLSETVIDGSGTRSFRVRLDLEDHDQTRPLIIEPTSNFADIMFSTFLGGSTADEGEGIAVDSVGNVYLTGRTFSTDFPTTAGAFDTAHNGSVDVFVSKLDATGTNLLYSTFLGGTGTDIGFEIAVNSAGDAFITGSTDSVLFPTTAGIDTTHNGQSDVFVTKLNATGSALAYSTFLGGNQGDDGRGIVLDPTGIAYVCGGTRSANYPTNVGAFDTVHNGSQDAFVTKINAAGTSITYSTFLGGSTVDSCSGIAIDSTGAAFIAGSTQSSGFPTVAGSFDTTYTNQNDVFVSKLNAAGSALIYSTFLGDSLTDSATGIAIDSAGNAFVTGQTTSPDFPVTVGAYNETHNGAIFDSDVFVTKLNSNGTALVYSTFLGGASPEIGNAIVINSVGDAYVTGYTASAAFPTTMGAFDTTHNGDSDVFVTKLNAAGSALTHSTFIGDTTWDEGMSIAIDASGNAFVAGRTQGSAFPTTAGYDTTHNGGFDAFVTKLQLDAAVPGILQLSAAAYGGSEGSTLTVTVNRVTGSDGIVGATYTLTDGTGNGGAMCGVGVDYINPGPQLLSFGDTITSQPINVTLCSDLVTDPAETFTITLSSPTGGATLGAPVAATGTITHVPPPFIGSYTVGSAGADYPSLTLAGGIFEAINAVGATGPVTINIITDLAGETGVVPLNPIAGNPTVLIKPSGAPRMVSGNAVMAVIRIEGADNVTIDGSTAATVVGGTPALRELTVVQLNTLTNTAAIHIGSTTESSHNNVVRNVIASGNGSTQTLAGIYAGNGSVGGTASFPNNGIRIENCSVRGAVYGIMSFGVSPANPNTGTIISENDLTSTGANRIGVAGIWVLNDDGAQINQNSIGGIDSSLTGDSIGILAGTTGVSFNGAPTSFGVTNAMIVRNRINGVRNDNTHSAVGILLVGSTNSTNTIANNMVSGVISDAANSDLPAGIFVVSAAGSTTRVYYNSVSMTGDRSALTTPSTTMNPGFAIAITGTNPTVELKNNIFSTSQTASGGGPAAGSYAIGIASSAFTNLDSNYNALYSTGANDGGFRATTLSNTGGTDHATISNWQAATGGGATDDFSSVEGDPSFVNAASDLHIYSTTALIVDKGTPVSVLDDFDGQLRSLVGFAGGVPDIGADEAVGPVAANVSVAGRVTTSDGLGLRNAIVTVTGADGIKRTATTSSFGYFRVDELEAGSTVVVTVSSKRYIFAPRVITLSDEITELEIVSN